MAMAMARNSHDSRRSELPRELVEVVMLRTGPVAPFRLGAVCRAWHRVHKSILDQHGWSLPDVPWLVVGPYISLRGYCFSLLFPRDGSRCSLPFRRSSRPCCIASFGNYIMMEHSGGPTYFVDPFTGEERPSPFNVRCRFSALHIRIAFSSSPLLPSCDMVVTYNPPYFASFMYRRGLSDHWTPCHLYRGSKELKTKEVAAVGAMFYALTHEGRLVEIDLQRQLVGRIVEEAGILKLDSNDHRYLVESQGDLLAVDAPCLNCWWRSSSPLTWQCRVRKFDKERSVWVELDSLGDRDLFVGPIGSVSVVGAGRIYAAARGCCFEYKLGRVGGRRIGTRGWSCWSCWSCWCPFSYCKPAWVFPRLSSPPRADEEMLQEPSTWSCLRSLCLMVTDFCGDMQILY